MKTRPLTLDDATAVHHLVRSWEEFWDVPLVTPIDEIQDEFTAPFVDLDVHTIGCWDDDRLVAYGQVWYRPSGENQERAYLFGRVHPEHRKRGFGRSLIGWQIDTATRILNAVPNDLPKYVRADEWDWIEESHRMYLRFGMKPVRYFTEMLKHLDGPSAVVETPGIEIQLFDRSRTDEVMHVLNESFRDHWGSTPTDVESFQHRLSGHGLLLDASYLALSDGNVVGFTLNSHYPSDEALLGRRDGWVETLGVLSGYRKRGIATALLQTSFNAFLERGLTHSAIGVDTASPTDAHGLYASLGYVPTHRSITSEFEVTG